MRFLLLILFNLSIFAHSTVEKHQLHEERLNYGVFTNITYRDKDLYPQGIEGSVGYENHGKPKAGEINHIGLFANGKYESTFLYGVELNRHVDAPNTIDSYLEKLYVGYTHENYSVVAGREYNNISFVKEKAWGYGFAQMPIAIDSFVDSTYIGDGVFLDYKYNDFKAYLDITKDKYNQIPRTTMKIEYNLNAIKFISYLQLRNSSQMRVDYTTTQHTHTHANQNGCNNLTQNERCVERKNQIFGLGINTKIDMFDIQSEYIHLDTQGTISNNQYKIDSHNKIDTLYLQLLTKYKEIFFGLRSEWFMFSNNYTGGGATEVATILTTNNSSTIQNLQTIMSGYEFNKYNKVIIQAEHSQDDWAMRLTYALTFYDNF